MRRNKQAVMTKAHEPTCMSCTGRVKHAFRLICSRGTCRMLQKSMLSDKSRAWRTATAGAASEVITQEGSDCSSRHVCMFALRQNMSVRVTCSELSDSRTCWSQAGMEKQCLNIWVFLKSTQPQSQDIVLTAFKCNRLPGLLRLC